jgi:hypothetical protein
VAVAHREWHPKLQLKVSLDAQEPLPTLLAQPSHRPEAWSSLGSTPSLSSPDLLHNYLHHLQSSGSSVSAHPPPHPSTASTLSVSPGSSVSVSSVTAAIVSSSPRSSLDSRPVRNAVASASRSSTPSSLVPRSFSAPQQSHPQPLFSLVLLTFEKCAISEQNTISRFLRPASPTPQTQHALVRLVSTCPPSSVKTTTFYPT